MTQFSVSAALRLCDFTLAHPAASEFTQRPEPRGELVQRFALPLELCVTTNATRHAHPQVLARMKKQIGDIMLLQAGGRCTKPLDGRPQVICRRFSSVQPDAFSDWAKMPVDKLQVGKNRLGYLRDDNPKNVELYQVWEFGPRGGGCVVIEVRS